MKIGDLLVVGLAAYAIYILGNKYLWKDAKKPFTAIVPATPKPERQQAPQVITIVKQPSMNNTDMDVVKWVENY